MEDGWLYPYVLVYKAENGETQTIGLLAKNDIEAFEMAKSTLELFNGKLVSLTAPQ